MCGIFGAVSNKSVTRVLMDCLGKLEYRGYDSAGIAVLQNGCLAVRKGAGKLSEVASRCCFAELEGGVGIGHVRWATHGGVDDVNAHPHCDCYGQVAVVHNGIIENYSQLRAELVAKGHKMASSTDTEVIAHFVEQYKGEGVNTVGALALTIKQLVGSFALLVICAGDPGKIFAAKRDSPLVIGKGDIGYYIASDALSMGGVAKEIVSMEDGEVAVVEPDGCCIFDGDLHNVKRQPIVIELGFGETSKQGHDFYMLKEILEQPQVIRNTVKQDKVAVMDTALDILRARQVLFIASGTARYASLVGRYVISKLASKFGETIQASESHYFADSIDKNTIVIAVSQSGETADVIHGVKQAKAAGARIFSVVNMPNSTLVRLSDKVLHLNCGPEMAVAATKSFTSQLVIFYMLAFAMVNRLDDGISRTLVLPQLIHKNINKIAPEVGRLAGRLCANHDFYYLGRGINFATAGEGALKLKEIAYVHAESMSAGELKHGALALIESGTPVIAICPTDYTYTEMLSNLEETKARGAYIVGISNKAHGLFDWWLPIPEVEEIFYPAVTVIPLQLFAYYSALIRGYDPDRPRNLAKSVTVR